MNSGIITIARYTLLEALRTRLPVLVFLTLLALLAASFFVETIAVTEGVRLQAGFYAAGMRLASVFIAGLYVLTSVTREFNDKGLDILLALDLPRSHYLLGKLAGKGRLDGLAPFHAAAGKEPAGAVAVAHQ